MWVVGNLGVSSPQVRLDTMLYLTGFNFALRSGDEHRNLTADQFEIDKDDTGEFLLYSEKTNFLVSVTSVFWCSPKVCSCIHTLVTSV